MMADVPRKRTLVAAILIGAALGAGVAAVDQARGVPTSAARIFAKPSAPLQSHGPGHPAAAPASSTGGAAALHESTAL